MDAQFDIGMQAISPEQRSRLWSFAKELPVPRGECLVTQGSLSDAVYLVVSGRFEVLLEGHADPISEVSSGEPIGEISFFADGVRTATVRAVRDSIVLELDRTGFAAACRDIPSLHDVLLRSLARRLSAATSRPGRRPAVAPLRTVALVHGGRDRLPDAFWSTLRSVAARTSGCLVLDDAERVARFGHVALDEPRLLAELNALEASHRLVIYVGDDELTDWTRRAIRQADELVVAVAGDTAAPLNAAERFGFDVHPAKRRRLVRLHPGRRGIVAGTAAWLEQRDVQMHHHLSLEDDEDFERLLRFLSGRAVGLVASGGGGLGPAHVGVYRALVEQGVKFDILGGTSVGAAMMAGFAFLASPAMMTAAIVDIFIHNRSFKRRTIPRYALLDHIRFDGALQRQYQGADIEDLWLPFFAIATDLTKEGSEPFVCRRGPVWKAVRASAAIPAVLPPMITADGRILVDGGLIDNIPLGPMKRLKNGPNVIIHFERAPFATGTWDYDAIPGRWRLAVHMLNPFRRRTLPDAPGPVAVLRRCMSISQDLRQLPLGPSDLVLTPPTLSGASLLSFDQHIEVTEAAYRWAQAALERMRAAQDPRLAEVGGEFGR